MSLIVARKEFREALRSPRFMVTVLLSLVFLPAALYVNTREYDRRLSHYVESQLLLSQQMNRPELSYDSKIDGIRPPSPHSPFFIGIEPLIPNRITSGREGFSLSNDQWISNPQSVLFGRVDLFFFVGAVLSLLAFVYASAALTSERDSGELWFTMTAPVTPRKILAGKLLGNFAALVLPYLAGLLVSLPIIWISPGLRADIPGQLLYLSIFVSISLIYLFCVISVGFLVLSFTRRRAPALNALLFVWVLFVYVIPKAAPIVAELVSPAASREITNLTQSQLRNKFDLEFRGTASALFDSIMRARGLDPATVHSPMSPDVRPEERLALASYWDEARAVRCALADSLASRLRDLDDAQSAAEERQQSLSTGLSRLSPYGSFASLIAAISASGPRELLVVEQNAREFQESVTRRFYDLFSIEYYAFAGTVISVDPKVSPSQLAASLPELNYRRPSIISALLSEWPDLVLLFLFAAVSATMVIHRASYKNGR